MIDVRATFEARRISINSEEIKMSKIKIVAILSVLGLVAIVLNVSSVFVSRAEDDKILEAIAGYKNWARVTKDPIEIDIDNIAISG